MLVSGLAFSFLIMSSDQGTYFFHGALMLIVPVDENV